MQIDQVNVTAGLEQFEFLRRFCFRSGTGDGESSIVTPHRLEGGDRELEFRRQVSAVVQTEQVQIRHSESDRLSIDDDSIKFARRRSLEVQTEEALLRLKTSTSFRLDEDGDA